MTPAQERALLEATVAGLDDELRQAYSDLVELIRGGMAPREAVQQVMDAFQGDMAGTMATALSGIMQQAIGAADVMALEVGAVQLSRKLYAQASVVENVVADVVRRHVQGFADSRRLALDLFEGYGFREPGAEPLQINRRNPQLPKYMREALLSDDGIAGAMRRAFARIQVDGLETGPLRAAYSELLEAIDGIEAGKGEALIAQRIKVAFYERMRYFATRIARTELHRSYMQRESAILMDDDDIEFVQVRRAPGRGEPCICVLFTGRDMYGLGAGVYPKAQAPRPPFHPFCRCVVSPRLDLTGKQAAQRDEGADVYFLRRLDGPLGGRIMGSQAKRDTVLRGEPAEAVASAGRPPEYRIGRVGEK